MRVAVLGDCLLDVSVAPASEMQHGGDVPADISLHPGGQAANIAVRLARRAVATRLLAPMAEDPVGDLLRAWLGAERVELLPLPAPRSGAVVVLRTRDGERTMLSERASLPAGWLARVADAISDVDWLVCSGYMLLDPEGAHVAAALAARADGVRLAVAGSPLTARDADALRERMAACHPDLVVLSRDEARALGTGLPGLVVVTDPSGSVALGSAEVRVDAPATRSVDSTGAGDAFVAALLAGLGDERWPPRPEALRTAMRGAVEAGSQAVAVRGAQGRTAGEESVRSAGT